MTEHNGQDRPRTTKRRGDFATVGEVERTALALVEALQTQRSTHEEGVRLIAEALDASSDRLTALDRHVQQLGASLAILREDAAELRYHHITFAKEVRDRRLTARLQRAWALVRLAVLGR